MTNNENANLETTDQEQVTGVVGINGEQNLEVVATLIRGTQSEKIVEGDDGERVVRHKKPEGYALKDLTTGDFIVASNLESTEQVLEKGAINVIVTNTRKNDGTLSPYIRSASGFVPLQDESLVRDPSEFVQDFIEEVNENTGEMVFSEGIIVTEEMQEKLARYYRYDNKVGSRRPEQKHTPEELLASVRALRQQEKESVIEDTDEAEKAEKTEETNETEQSDY